MTQSGHRRDQTQFEPLVLLPRLHCEVECAVQFSDPNAGPCPHCGGDLEFKAKSIAHGELLKLGFAVAQSSVAKYMVKRHGPPSQGWRTFLRNHAPDIAAMDLFIVPTLGFDLLYAFIIIRLNRRDLVWINVTTNPTAEWIARQITEAFPWNEAPRYLVRDRDQIYGSLVPQSRSRRPRLGRMALPNG